MNAHLEAALQYAERGWAVFPLVPRKKIPLTPNGFKDASTDPKQIRRWWKQHSQANVGIATGASKLTVIDGDVKHGHDPVDSLMKLVNGANRLPETLRAATPSGGWHLYFKAPEGVEIRNSAEKKLGPGLDVRGDGGYVVAPPSVVDDDPAKGVVGGAYWWINGADEPMAALPEWLASAAINGVTAKGETSTAVSAIHGGLPAGRRNDGVFRYACRLRADGVSADEARALVLEAAARCEPPMDAAEALRCVASAYRYPADFHLTDLGNAFRFVARHGEDARYVPDFRKWLTWDGQRWLFDEDGEAVRRAKETALSVYAEAAAERDEARRKATARWAAESEAEKRLKAMVELAKTEPGIPVRPNELDADPLLLGVANGVLDLRTGALREPRREDLITKRAPVEFLPGAACPTWLRFLDRVFAGQADLIGFMQRAVGYSLAGHTSEQCFFLLYGTGANGKSTLLGALDALLGDYAMTAPAATFMEKDRGGANNDIARLRGARLVSAIETEDGQRLAESLVKQVTGQDTVTARFLYAEFFEFAPAFKLWLAVNHKPTIKGDDYAIWRRIRLVPFTVRIPDEEKDGALPTRLRAELPGILNWALEGCRLWQESGLAAPEAVTAATAEYRADMDVMQQFFDECCSLSLTGSVGASTLYAAYKRWSEGNTGWSMSQTRFGRTLKERGFDKQRVGARRNQTYIGIVLIQSEEDF
jgi:putative DNA primase/helicase